MTGPRRGLVLGAGGVLGAAWTVGALAALEEVEGFDPRGVERLLGTSAGSVMAATLGSGVGVSTLLNHQRGVQGADDPVLRYDHETDSGGATPPPPRPGIGSPSLLLTTALHPLRHTPMTAFTALLPAGRASIAPVGRLVDELAAADGWAAHPSTWIVAMDYDTGRRVVFGRSGSPPARLAEAVQASCAIPGWYSPVTIGGHRYVDGGACSATSADVLAGLGLDEVHVIAPMASFSYDAPTSVAGRLERRVRRAVTKRLIREKRKLEAEGTRVVIVAPTAEDLDAIGANLMDPSRRLAVLETSLRTSPATLLDRRAADGAATRAAG